MSDIEIRVRIVRANYTTAVREAYAQISRIRDDLNEVEQDPAAAFTPGNISMRVACLEAAMAKAHALRDAMATLGHPISAEKERP